MIIEKVVNEQINITCLPDPKKPLKVLLSLLSKNGFPLQAIKQIVAATEKCAEKTEKD